MKKLVLFFAVAAAISFAACSNANKTQEEAQPEAAQEQVEAPAPVVEEAVVDSAAVVAPEVAPAEVK